MASVETIVLYCKFRASFVPISLGPGYAFVDLIRVIGQRFGLDVKTIALTYVVVEGQSCLLRSEEELSDLRSLCAVLGLKLVNVTVSDSASVVESICSSVIDDEVGNRDYEVSSNRRFYMSAGWENLITGVGQIFKGGVHEFRSALKKYSIERRREFHYDRNTTEKVYAHCVEKGNELFQCRWLIKANVNPVDKSFVITKFLSEHDCPVSDTFDSNKRFGFKMVSELVKEAVKEKPNIRAGAVVWKLKDDYGFKITYYKAWMAIQMAKGLYMGDKESFKQLEGYIEALHKTNPGSSALLEVDPVDEKSKKFKRLFFSLPACSSGYKYVRPLLFIDATFLKGKYRGTLLAAVGKNGNGGLYPVAFAVVDAENKENWLWFLENLKILIGANGVVTFFSDRNVGILDGVSTVFPHAVHYYCLQHLKDNLKTRFSGGDAFFAKTRSELVQLFDDCAKATTVEGFEVCLNALLEKGGKKMEDFLSGFSVETWAHAFSVTCRYGESTSNAVESFNSWILEIRKLPITDLVDNLRIKLMVWHDERKTKSAAWKSVLCPHYQKIWDNHVHNSRPWLVRRASDVQFEVCSVPSHSVNLRNRTCSCRVWEIEGFPCIHSVCSIIDQKLRMIDFVEPFFWAENYRKSYEFPVNPVPSCLWRDVVVNGGIVLLPPDVKKRQSGRPTGKRIPTRGEVVSKIRKLVKCGRCRKLGHHNSRTCTELMIEN